MDAMRWDDRPRLRHPVLVAAFEGWNDAADAASTAAASLAASWAARPFGAIDPEDFYDFTVARPRVELVDGITRRIEWPEARLSAAAVPGTGRDAVFLQAVEPHLRWRAFTATVVAVARELEVELAVTLGALLAQVPHTRPARVSATSADPALLDRLGLQRSQYEGPTGIVGVLHDALGREGIPSASLWASVPHYLPSMPSPPATLALVRRAASLLGAPVGTADLEAAAVEYDEEVGELVAGEEKTAAYVRRLELEEAEDEAGEAGPPALDTQLPSSDDLAAEVERFLRDEPSE